MSVFRNSSNGHQVHILNDATFLARSTCHHHYWANVYHRWTTNHCLKQMHIVGVGNAKATMQNIQKLTLGMHFPCFHPLVLFVVCPVDCQFYVICEVSQIAKFMGPSWGPPGSCRPQMGPMLAPWTLLSGPYQGRDGPVDPHGISGIQGTGQSGWIPLSDNIGRSSNVVTQWNPSRLPGEQIQVQFDRLRDLHSVISRVEYDSTQSTQLAN